MAKPSTIRELEEFVRQKQGDFGSKRVQRAADEIPNLERMYTQGALQNAFAGDLPQALMTMNPAEFEKFATPIPRQVERLGKRHTRDREEVAFKDYIKHLGKLEGGFDSVPRLEINKQNSLPFHHVAAHEGRHRSRALTKNKVDKALVGLVPQMIDKPMSQEELLQEMRAKLYGRPLVIPQNTYAGVSRRQLELPDYYAEGGKVDELKDEFMRLAQGGSTIPEDVKAKLDQLKQEFTQLAERDRRAAQATWNAEQAANKKAKGGKAEVTKVTKKSDDRIAELEEAARALLAGQIKRSDYDKLIKKLKPVRPYTSVPAPATDEEALNALMENKRKSWKANQFQAGDPVGMRLDIPAYQQHGVWVNSLHDESGRKMPTSYAPVSSVRNAVFDAKPSQAQKVAVGETNKSPFAKIKGEWHPVDEQEALAQMQEYLNHPEWHQVGMDPRRRDYFYSRKDSRKPVTNAEHVLQIGPLVLAKNPTFGKRKDFGLKQGGNVSTNGMRYALTMKQGKKHG